MPPLASWNLPRCLSCAPVKLPFSWPNRMLSTRLAGRAPQFTATNGLPARSLLPCTARAIISLPTPLSPRISTGIEDRAARSPRDFTARMGRLSPIRSAKVMVPAWRFFSRSTSPFSEPICRAFWMEMMIRSGEAGLMKKSWAPACMALTTVSTPPVAVSTITGMSWPRARRSFSTSIPGMAGMTRSRMTTSGDRPAASWSRALSPPSAWETANPSRSSTAWISRR